MSGDAASESGSSCSSKMDQELRAEEQLSSTPTDSAPSGKTMEGEGAAGAPGKVVEEEAGAGAGAVGGAAVSNIERLLQQQRSEIMFELRRLQMGERPVTGQGNKEAVESFFTSQMQPNERAGDEHRPETVHVEVRALAESRPVSSLLHSTRFRRSLESALRTAIGSSSPRGQSSSQTPSPRATPRPAPRLSVARRSVEPRVPSPLTLQHGANSSEPAGAIPVPPPPPAVEALLTPQQQEESQEQQQEPVLAEERRYDAYPERWLLHNVPSVSEQRSMGVWPQLEEMQREDFISEISDLVQRQLVTQSLGGSFRSTMENMMQQRLATVGSRGEQTLQYIQSLQPSIPHLRNDFSELGISAPGSGGQGAGAMDGARSTSDPLDDVSVISATAAVTVQQSQQQLLMSREMRALKAQMNELKSMLKMSMDMQLDTHRAIRQEVAAALTQQGAAPPPAVPAPGRAAVDDAQCLICIEAAADSVLYRCGHLCVCHGCGLELKQRGCHCPVCRAPIVDIIRAYKSGQS